MYVYPKFSVNWTMKMGDMAKSPFLQFFFLLLSLFSFFSLNPCISKTIRGTDLKFTNKLGLMTQLAVFYQNVGKNFVYL